RIASPIVRRLVRDAGLDPAELTGTGPGGMIVRADVERAIAERVTPPAPAPASASGVERRTGLPEARRVPLTGVRGAIAATLSRSRSEIPEATTWVDVDATGLLALREQMRRDDRRP